MFRLALLIASIGLLAACGLKGPLYLPEKQAPVVITPSAPSADSAASSSSSESSQSSRAAP